MFNFVGAKIKKDCIIKIKMLHYNVVSFNSNTVSIQNDPTKVNFRFYFLDNDSIHYLELIATSHFCKQNHYVTTINVSFYESNNLGTQLKNYRVP